MIYRRMKLKKYSKESHSDSSGLNCTTYDLRGAITDKKSSCVGIGMPTGMNNNNSDENLAMEPILVEEKLSKIASSRLMNFTHPRLTFRSLRRTFAFIFIENQFQLDLRPQRRKRYHQLYPWHSRTFHVLDHSRTHLHHFLQVLWQHGAPSNRRTAIPLPNRHQRSFQCRHFLLHQRILSFLHLLQNQRQGETWEAHKRC